MSSIKTDAQSFDEVYTTHYAALYRYAHTMVADDMLAEEMVHQVFLKILEKKGVFNIHTSIKSYLYRAVHNECLNHIKHEKVKQLHISYTNAGLNDHNDTPAGNIQYKELEVQLRQAINELPEACRTVFQLSRYEELRYSEIAAQLGISVKTVENQMSKALKRLRIQLADYLPFILWLLFHHNSR